MTTTRSNVTRRIGAALVLMAAALAAGCGGLGGGSSFDPSQSCQAVGGSYYGGMCHAGNG